MENGSSRRRWRRCSPLAAVAAAAAAAARHGPVTITIAENYGTEQNATALNNLAAAFHKLHPNITVKIQPQNGDNYFALLQADAISKSGPDLAVMWTGLFTLQYKSFLTNLKGEIPAADLARVDPNALKWTSDGFNRGQRPLRDPAGEPVLHRLLQQG